MNKRKKQPTNKHKIEEKINQRHSNWVTYFLSNCEIVTEEEKIQQTQGESEKKFKRVNTKQANKQRVQTILKTYLLRSKQ